MLILVIISIVTFAVVNTFLMRQDQKKANASSWYDYAWRYRKVVTIDHTLVASNQSSFPVLIKLASDSDIVAHAQTDGDDLLFTSSDGSTKIPYELENYNSSTGATVAWVKSNISSTSDTILYLYYGNDSCSPQADPTNVWDTNYKMVQHYNEASGTLYDSTANNNDGTASASGITYGATGEINKALGFDGLTGQVSVGDSDSLDITSNLTLQGWVKRDSGSEINSVVSKSNYSLKVGHDDKPYFQITTGAETAVNLGNPATGTWWTPAQIVFNGKLFIFGDNGTIYRLDDGPTWTGVGTITNMTWNGAASFVVFGGKLYIGTGTGSNGTGTIFEWDGNTTWTAVGSSLNRGVNSMVVYNGKIYAGTYGAACVVYRYDGGTTWTSVGCPGAMAGVNSLVIFNGQLYAGGTGVYRYDGGTTWTSIGSPGNVGKLLVFNDTIYASVATTTAYRFDGGTTWTALSGTATTYNVYALVSYNGKLYAGTRGGNYLGTLERYDDGVGWTKAATYGAGVVSAGVYDGKIFTTPDHTNHAIWQTGEGAAVYSSDALAASTWTQVAGTYDGSTLTILENGVSKGTKSKAMAIAANTGSLLIGKSSGSLAYEKNFQGSLEDIRVSSTARSADWLLTEYNNQSAPDTFLSLSAEEQGDVTPPENPTTFHAYDTAAKGTELTTNNWYNFGAPYFEWSGAADNESGIKGYWVYFGTDPSAIPSTAGDYQAHVGAIGATQNYTVSDELVTGSTYYLIIQTQNDAGPPNDLVAPEVYLVYKYETVTPQPPEYINASPTGCSTASTFTFTWPDASDSGGSSLAGYEYKRWTNGPVAFITDTTMTVSPMQEGDNVFYVRSKDHAGNLSSWQTAIFCSTGIAHIIDGPYVTAGPSSMAVTWTSSKNTTSLVQVYDGNVYVSEQGNQTYGLSHNVTVVGLKPEKTYRYKLVWLDQSANAGESEWFETTTATTPRIINPKAETISPTRALLSFQTNYLSSISIRYGAGVYGDPVPLPGQATAFTYELSNLEPGTNYQIAIDAVTSLGADFSGGATFATPPAPKITNLRFQPVTDKPYATMSVTWTTNVETTSSIHFGPIGGSFKEISSSEKVKEHSLEIGNLSDNTQYQVYATGIDQYGNTATSDTNTFKTALDSRPPVVTDLTIESKTASGSDGNKAQIVVSWRTDEPGTSQVEYGEGVSSDSYGSKTQEDLSYSNAHVVVISNLDPSKTYHLRAVSKDAAGNIGLSEDNAVITQRAQQSALNLIIQAFQKAFSWVRIFGQ